MAFSAEQTLFDWLLNLSHSKKISITLALALQIASDRIYYLQTAEPHRSGYVNSALHLPPPAF
jgi:hypothetical protein